MKDSTDAKEKTSRRSFAKSVATALVAAPVVSSLSSCQTATVPPSPRPYRDDANPPVIIDGGSFQIMIPAKLQDGDDDTRPPRKYDHKYSQINPNSLGVITGIHIVDDYASDVLPNHPLGNDTLQVHIWIAKVLSDNDNENNGDVVYEDISQHHDPDIVIQGGKVEIRLDKKLDNDNDRKLYKRKKKNQKRYHIHDWEGGHTPFRIAKVVVMVSSSQTALYDSERDHTNVENGFRIILIF